MFRKKPTFSRQESLAAKPVRLVEGELVAVEGGAKLKVPLKHSRMGRWLLRLPDNASKTFELDALGLLVRNSCDGKTSVKQIIRTLARQYHLNLREAEIPTLSFLHTLAKKGLIGIAMDKKKKS